MMTENTATATPTPAKLYMSFEQIEHILQMQQRLTAREALTKTDRQKRTLTKKQIFNRYAQMGHKLRYKDIWFTFFDGNGYIQHGAHGVWGATITDFYNKVKEVYGHRIKALED